MLEPWPKLRAWAYSLDRARFERIEPPVRIGSSLRVGDGEHDRLPNYYDEDTKTFTFEYRRIRSKPPANPYTPPLPQLRQPTLAA